MQIQPKSMTIIGIDNKHRNNEINDIPIDSLFLKLLFVQKNSFFNIMYKISKKK